MYIELHPNPIINEIMCIPFETLRLNDKTYEKCVQTLGNDIPDDAIIVYSPSESEIIVLGYYLLDNLNMKYSDYFDALRESTFRLCGFDPIKSVNQIDCIHIKEWIFDNSLRNKEHLSHIFLNITLSCPNENGVCMLWNNSIHHSLLFYPIHDMELSNYAAIFYFSDAFLNE